MFAQDEAEASSAADDADDVHVVNSAISKVVYLRYRSDPLTSQLF